ncbi:MAG: ion transporter [Betaproteobacteria bacterium]|nr:ion transporter [Betaproteobacteria bacterium]
MHRRLKNEPAAPPGDHSLEAQSLGKPAAGWRRTAFTVIFESDTRAGRAYDVGLLVAIVASVVVVMLDSVQAIGGRYDLAFELIEWGFTLVFTLEYGLRLACVERRLRYAGSFFGVVDLLAVLPTYLAFFFPGLHALIDIRMLRMLRVFRILKLTAYIREYRLLGDALRASRRKIFVFIGTVSIIVVVLATLMYVIEGPANGFTSIPLAVYWAISTITTVGFGDIVPRTDIGRAIASFMMLLGWGILAVPTGIVTAELTSRHLGREGAERRCTACGSGGHTARARYCQDCGAALGEP